MYIKKPILSVKRVRGNLGRTHQAELILTSSQQPSAPFLRTNEGVA